MLIVYVAVIFIVVSLDERYAEVSLATIITDLTFVPLGTLIPVKSTLPFLIVKYFGLPFSV